MTRRPLLLSVLLCLLLPACTRGQAPAPLRHEAYIWQRSWSDELGAAVEEGPAELEAYRVLAEERWGHERAPARAGVVLRALAAARRPVVIVLRVDGSRPLDGLSLRPMVELARAWRARGVQVRGLEVDHDCPSAALGKYAAWLTRERPLLDDPGAAGESPGGRNPPRPSELRLSVTALPTWSRAPELPRLVAAVDHVVLQLHAIRAPTLFDPDRALLDLERWARVTHRPFRAALPTYRARLRAGGTLAAEPAGVARLLAMLRERPVPYLAGVVWFRLGHRGDPDAWSPRTLAAVVRGEPLAPRLATRLVCAGDGELFDIQLENTGSVDGELPRELRLAGSIEVLEGLRGYAALGRRLVLDRPARLRPGESVLVGFARGKEIALAR